MDTTDENNPQTPADEPELSIEQQLDQLLVAIETQEPGTVEEDKLPADFVKQRQDEAQATEPDLAAAAPIEAAAPAAEPLEPAGEPDEVAAALAQFEEALDTAEQEAQAPAAEPASEPAAPETSQADMLAALNTALQNLEPDDAANFGPPKEKPAPLPEPTPSASEPAEAVADPTADRLTDEINALLNAPAEVVEQAPASAAAIEDTETQNKIAEEIEGLLSANADPAQADQATTIDDLDQMLAEEIDLDEELSGEFHSVEDVTAGIQVPRANEQIALDDDTASAKDVAAELDSQPENAPPPPSKPSDPDPEPAEDPFAALSAIAETAEKNEVEHQKTVARAAWLKKLPKWLNWVKKIDAEKIDTARERLLEACFLINWPARRFLSTEWRANLGYIAILNLFGAAAVWMLVIFF